MRVVAVRLLRYVLERGEARGHLSSDRAKTIKFDLQLTKVLNNRDTSRLLADLRGESRGENESASCHNQGGPVVED